ncbi:polysaccharide biosynthesis protein, partial [Pelagibacteraceae bacterium]|nr:polysaccharide biosynthesis protein [Pelagibacteraceae bacterium]
MKNFFPKIANKNKYSFFEEKVISKKNRFKLLNQDIIELKKNFFKSNILITGAAGSIGSQFCQDILKFNFKSIFLMDKNENQLTELNRDLILVCDKKKINKIRFICSDLTIFNIDNFLKENKITHYLNFAAIKHVRSEEELTSIKYMFLTNSISFLPSKSYYLKKIFSISTDKIVNPTSVLGISKYLMEANLKQFKKKNNIFVSSVRFGNVSFSNGSVLKYVVDRIKAKKPFGVPKKLRRFFITHKEASSLCFKSLLNRNNGYVVLPDYKALKRDYLITEVVNKILKLFNYKG